jgi:hypothetical protein
MEQTRSDTIEAVMEVHLENLTINKICQNKQHFFRKPSVQS